MRPQRRQGNWRDCTFSFSTIFLCCQKHFWSVHFHPLFHSIRSARARLTPAWRAPHVLLVAGPVHALQCIKACQRRVAARLHECSIFRNERRRLVAGGECARQRRATILSADAADRAAATFKASSKRRLRRPRNTAECQSRTTRKALQRRSANTLALHRSSHPQWRRGARWRPSRLRNSGRYLRAGESAEVAMRNLRQAASFETSASLTTAACAAVWRRGWPRHDGIHASSRS